jgi:hypothetical protein
MMEEAESGGDTPQGPPLPLPSGRKSHGLSGVWIDLLAMKTQALVSDNVCRTCFSEWVDVWDEDGNHVSQKIRKHARIDEGALPAPGRS